MAIKRALLQSIATLLITLSFKLALAVVPSTMNYQGHLTDNNGVPIDGPVNLVFAIYDVEIGGTALWSETQSVTVSQGVFSIELGGISPFPPGLESPLWLGLTVDTDAEMTPRRPFSSVGFAFKASDADALEGMSASTLDQSAHVIDTANPHSVTAAQAGAADAATVAAHIGNTANPHTVTAAQTGAASDADFTAHAADSAAHHLRYSNAEAVAAMGAKSDANALHHDRFTDANVVTAMLANDGAGSTLDADQVDGLEASELIDAAQDEVRTPISTLPFTISQPGSYYLTGNLNGSSGGIDINANDVTLDLMGFTIDGGGSVNDHGIYATNRSNVTIRNGTVRDFGLTGIIQSYTLAHDFVLVNVHAIGNGTLGTITDQGINIVSSNALIRDCTAGDNNGSGIEAGVSARLINNTAYGNGGDSAIRGSFGAIISGNTAYENSSTYAIRGEYTTRISGNTAYANTGNYAIYGHYGSIISDNTAYNNSVTYGIYGNNSTTIDGNTAYANTATTVVWGQPGSIIRGNSLYTNTATYGIYGNTGSTIEDNSVSQNATTYGIYGNTGSAIAGNTAYQNAGWGIYGFAANSIRNNTLYSNNTDANVNVGGLRLGNDSRVTGNTLDANSQNNIYTSSGDSILMENHVTDSTNGINFTSVGNYYRDNTAAGNTNAFVNGASQTDGGGNVAF